MTILPISTLSSSSISIREFFDQVDDKMPMVSVPWSQPASVVVILLGEHLSEREALNLSYAISFIGPLLLGGLIWEILTIDVAQTLQYLIGCFIQAGNEKQNANRKRSSSNQSKESMHSQAPQRETEIRKLTFSSFIERPQIDEKQKDEKVQNDNQSKSNTMKILSILKHLSSFLAKASALALITLYIAYTHGDHEIQCGSWPHTIAGLGAIATSMITLSIFFNAFLIFSNCSKWLFLPLCIATIAQFGLSFATIATWRGGLRPSGVACYLRISRWSGIFHLGNLLFLVILPFLFFFQSSSTTVNHRKEGHKHKSSGLDGNSSTYGKVTSGTLSNALSKFNRENLIKRNRLFKLNAANSEAISSNTTQDRLPSDPEQVQDWITARLATSTKDLPAREDDENRLSILSEVEGILIVPGQPVSSYGSKSHTICISESNVKWTNYIIWWFVAFCTALCGTIVCFANWSGILIFSYYPISVVLFVLFCQQLTRSPNSVFVKGQKVNLADLNKSDEEHRRNRLGSSPMSIRLAAAAASTNATLNTEEMFRKTSKQSSKPRRSSAADATSTKFRDLFPVHQKSLRNSLDRSFSTRKPVPTQASLANDASAESVTMAGERKAIEASQEKEGEDFATKFTSAVGTLMRKSSNFSLKSRIGQLMRDSSNQGRPNSSGNGSDLEDGLGGHEFHQDPLMRLASQGLASSLHSTSTHPNRISPSTKRSSGSSGKPIANQQRSPQETSMEETNNQLHDEKLSRNLLKFNSLTERKARMSGVVARPSLDRRYAGALDVSLSPPNTATSMRSFVDDHSLSRDGRMWRGQQSEDTLWANLTDDESQNKQGLQPRYRQRKRVLMNGPIPGRKYEIDSLISPRFQLSSSNDTAHTKNNDHASLPNSPAVTMQSEESENTLPTSPQIAQKSFVAAKSLMPLGYRPTTLSPMLEVSERPSSILQQNNSNQFPATPQKGSNRNRSGSLSTSSQEQQQATYDTFGIHGIVSIDSVPGIISRQSTVDVPLVIPNDSPGAVQINTGRDRGLSNPNSISSVMLIGIPATANSNSNTKSEIETSSRIQTLSNDSITGNDGNKSKSSSSKKVSSSEAESSADLKSIYHSPAASLTFEVIQTGAGATENRENTILTSSNPILSTKAIPITTIDSLRQNEVEEEIENLKSNDSKYVENDEFKGKQKAKEQKQDKSSIEQFLQEAKLGDSINLSDDIDIDQQPDWVLADEQKKERDKKLDQALKVGIEMADEDVLSIFLDKRGFSRAQAEELNAHRNERRKKRLSKEMHSMRSAPTEMERILSGGTVSTFHEDDELSFESNSSTSQAQHDKLSNARKSPSLIKRSQDQNSELSFGLHDIADNPKLLQEKSYRPLSPSNQKVPSSLRKKRKQKQKERAKSPDDLQIRAAEAVVQAAPHRTLGHTSSFDDLIKNAKENVSPLLIPSATVSPHATKLPSPMDQIEKPILEHKASFGQGTIGGISVDSDHSRTGAIRQIYTRQNSGSHSTFSSSERRNQHSNSSYSGSAAVSEHGESISSKSPMTGMGERGGIDIMKKHVLQKVNPKSSPIVTPQSALIALAGPPSHPPNIPLPPPPPEAEIKPKDISPISGNSLGALSTTSLNNQRTLTRVEENSDDSRPSTPEMAAKAKAILKQRRITPQRSESSTSVWNSAKEDDSIAESSAYESDEKLPGNQKQSKSKQKDN